MESTAIDTLDGVDATDPAADVNIIDDPVVGETDAAEPTVAIPPSCSGFGAVVDSLFNDGRLVHLETIAPRPAIHAGLESDLPAAIAHCLPDDGLYRHQAEAIDLIRKGRSVVVATGTASGKSLCFQIPIAESIVTGLRSGTSLLLYPTKALAQDQLRAFNELDVKGMKAATYDGDASRDERTWARNNANVLLTNPEMLHHGLLPHHGKWATFLKRLDYIVIDELHVFRGIFGTHLAHVLRRLRRMCQRYGSDPTFVFCSATIGRPEELASELCGKDVVAVTDDGSPYGRRHIALVQPAWIDAERGIRQSPATETIRVITDLVLADRRIIAFCGSRALTERVAAGVARNLPPELRDMVRPYRSGYLAAERREIEAELTGGSLRAVVTTSALELGVDISGLDATVLCGFPGTVASMWQQIGRAGRLQQDSLAVLVAGDDQLDQWFMANPNELFERPPEPAVVNVTNPNILDPHLGCAAFEWPLKHNDDEWWPDLDEAVRRNVLADQMRIRPDGRRLPRAVWDGPGMPFHRIGLRSASGGELRIVDDDGDLIGTVEMSRAAHLVHPGAVYLHRGQSFKVLDLDLAARTATVEPDDGSTWTQAKLDDRHRGTRHRIGQGGRPLDAAPRPGEGDHPGRRLPGEGHREPRDTGHRGSRSASRGIGDDLDLVRVAAGTDRPGRDPRLRAPRGPPRRGAHRHRHPPPVHDLRSVGRRRRVDRGCSTHRAADHLHLRRLSRRRRDRRSGVLGRRSAPGGHRRHPRRLPVCDRVPVVCAVTEVRQRQRTARQDGGAGPAGQHTRTPRAVLTVDPGPGYSTRMVTSARRVTSPTRRPTTGTSVAAR